MFPTSYSRRGRRTLIILLILRLIPPLFFLMIVLILAGLKNNFYEFVEQAGGNLHVFADMFSVIVKSGILLFVVLSMFFLVETLLEYWTVLYKFDEGAFSTRTGIFHLTELSIPYHQIENVDVTRPLLYRIFGVSRIVILTAGWDDNGADGHDSNQASLDLIDQTLAEIIKQELLKRSTLTRMN